MPRSIPLSAIVVAMLWLADGASAAGTPVYVFPTPGSQFAAPGAQIAFRGIPASQLGTVTVTGSVSGAHAGTVEADSDGYGGSFLPATPFAPGETVTVTTALNIEGSGSGAYQFQVAKPAGPLPFEHRPAAPRVKGDVWRFRSRPDLAPAAVTINKRDPGSTGDVFIAPQVGPLQQGPEIIGSNGGLIWFNPLPKDYAATDFRVQIYRGRPVLTWWQGNETAGVGRGQDMIMDSSYQVVKTVSAANGLSADLHEFQLTPRGTALITAEYPVFKNATSAGGAAREVVLDSVVQEIDVASGLLLFQWDSLDHVPLRAGYTKLPSGKHPNSPANPYDYFHVNSIGLDEDGNLLISARNTWAVYKVDHRTGAIIWTLGGKQSSFKFGKGASFAFQHDVRVRAYGDQFLTLFDDGAGPPSVHSQSRALKLELNVKHRIANVASQRTHSPPLLAWFEGSDEQMPGFGDFIGWGQQPYFSQYSANGKLVFEGHFVDRNLSYRAFRLHWSGTPSSPPAIATARHGRKMTVFASWNGATGVTGWRVLGGKRASRLGAIATAPRRGFETAINARTHSFAAVQALGPKGHVLATSPVRAVH